MPERQRQISINDVTLTEGDGGQAPAVFTVSLDAPSANPITVNFATADGTATAGSDYPSAIGHAHLRRRRDEQDDHGAVNGDTTVEPDESFVVNLSSPSGRDAAIGTDVRPITIDDDERRDRLSIATPA